jgi:predicted Zn-dependent protease
VLGHEFAHFEMRHTLDGFRRARTGSDILAWTTLLGAAASMYGGVRTGYIDSSFSIFGALSHYQREDERASDILGLSYVARAGYRPLAAADVWDNMMSETDARRVARGQRSIRYDGVAFFASHPTNLQRATYLRNMATLLPATQFDGRDRYQEVLGRLAETGWTGPLLFARGELYRTRGNPRDLVQAAEFYSAALNTDPTQIEAYRGLGLSLLRTGSVAEGRAAISNYLQAKPDASDAAMLRALVQG